MKTRRTDELTGIALDWAVAKSGGGGGSIYMFMDGHAISGMFNYSTNWAQGGPIIEQEGIRLHRGVSGMWWAATEEDPARPVSGPTPLVAAMRVYVLSRVGNEIDVPEELTKE